MTTHLITETAIIVHLPGRSRPDQIVVGHPNFVLVRDAVRKKDWDVVAKLIDIKTAIVQFAAGRIAIVDDEILWNGETVHAFVVDKILELMHEGEEIAPLVCFLERCLMNPEKRAVDELYQFLERGKMQITADGKFRAFKRVREDYLDVYSGTLDYSIGNIVSMPREEVNPNKHETCSTGLHFCSREYLGHFSGARIVEVEIDPLDVIAIPADYNNTKGRAAVITVIADIKDEEADTYFRGPVAASSVEDDVVVWTFDPGEADEEDGFDELDGYTVEFIALTNDGSVANATTTVEAASEDDARAQAKKLAVNSLNWDEDDEDIDWSTARVSEVY